MACRRHGAELEQFARDHDDIVQVIGVGSQDHFDRVLDFLDDTGMQTTTMLWERTGTIWRINDVVTNSALQLFAHDLSRESQFFFFDDAGRRTVLDAAPIPPWAP